MPHQCTNCGRTFPDGSKEMLSGCPDCGGNKFQFAPSSAVEGGGDADVTDDRSRAERDEAEPAEPPESADSSGVTARAAETVRGWVSEGTSEPDRSWPAADTPESEPPAEEFAEWPETARPPEDRSSPPPSAGTEESSAGGQSSRSPAESSPDSPTETRADSARPAAPGAASEEVFGDREDDGENAAQADARSEVVSPEELSATAEDRSEPPEHGRVVSEPSGEDQSLEDLREELNDQFESIKIVSPGQYELNLMELYDREEYIVSLQEDGRYIIDVPDSWRDSDG